MRENTAADTPDSLDTFYYDHLTWSQINEAVRAKKVVLLPIGSTEMARSRS